MDGVEIIKRCLCSWRNYMWFNFCQINYFAHLVYPIRCIIENNELAFLFNICIGCHYIIYRNQLGESNCCGLAPNIFPSCGWVIACPSAICPCHTGWTLFHFFHSSHEGSCFWAHWNLLYFIHLSFPSRWLCHIAFPCCYIGAHPGSLSKFFLKIYPKHPKLTSFYFCLHSVPIPSSSLGGS